MNAAELHRELVELARAAGFELRRVSGRAGVDTDVATTSGVCRVRDAIWVILSAEDTLEERNDALAHALRAYASELLESCYLPPAVRARLSAEPDRPSLVRPDTG